MKMALCNNNFWRLAHIPNIATLMLNKLISFVLSHYNQDIQNIQEQIYIYIYIYIYDDDDANNM